MGLWPNNINQEITIFLEHSVKSRTPKKNPTLICMFLFILIIITILLHIYYYVSLY